MAGIQDLISSIPVGDLADKLGVDTSTAADIVGKAIPALLGGMQMNATSGGASSLEKAVSGHSSALVDGGVNLDEVDTADGKKIVSHVFGDSKSKVAAAIGGGSSDLVAKALPLLAPIVMSYLAKRAAAQQKPQAHKPQGSGGISDILGGLLGGGEAGGGLSDLLGGLGGLLGGGGK